MQICRVTGQAVATVKDEALRASKLLIVQAADPAGKASGDPFVAVDAVGAGEGEIVLVAHGSAARAAARIEGPVDAAIVAIVDSLTVDGKRAFEKR